MKSVFQHLPETVLAQILENAFQWFVVVDKYGRILYINEDYCHFLEVPRDQAIGQPVEEIIENTKMHEVIKSGIADVASPHYIKGTYMLANRVPLIVDGEIVGAFGSVVFRDMTDWKKLSSHVRTTMEKIQLTSTDSNQNFYKLEDIKGSSQAIRSIKETIQMIAPSDLSVLIEGESGTGKELFAQSIHEQSDRSDLPFVKINCAAIPAELLEAEIFGTYLESKNHHRKGRFELADKGTLFIDEIGAMPLTIQAKLLRAIQEGEIEPIGSQIPKHVSVRIIAATNRPIELLMEQGKFREDLYYRIQAITLRIPPLRERMEDFTELANTFLQQYILKAGKRRLVLASRAREYLQNYHWPGNVRELQNVIQAAVYLAEDEIIEPTALPDQIKQVRRKTSKQFVNLQAAIEELERTMIQDLLKEETDKRVVAQQLGLSRSTLYEKIKKHNL
ncbi:sigma-54-dependent Fis family transcriptional regulator [Paenisporosarcina sp. OV554]|uniref:sigma-54 interaction domain-containing protein n=1 Tax=Paenisporosarcina sp. OV554 TaxID=2135694 RepID=UPI000D3D3576|nr:sigma 54-interacting transcriptional regulator [Paenisporosarcina sp. OV554]PUB09831.1 transcriptional regulator [Paenisporosarcina sp. OV554]